MFPPKRLRQNILLVFVLLTLLLTSHTGHSQKRTDGQLFYLNERVSLPDVFRAMFSEGDSVVVFDKCTFVSPPNWVWWSNTSYDSLLRSVGLSLGATINSAGQLVVKKRIIFGDNQMPTDDPNDRLAIQNMYFEKKLMASGQHRVQFYKCNFAGGLFSFQGPNYWIEQCTFRQSVEIHLNEFELLAFKNCTFDFDVPPKRKVEVPREYSGSETIDTLLYGRRNLVYGTVVPGITITGEKGQNFLFEKNTVRGDSINRFFCQVRNLDRLSFFQNDIDIDMAITGSIVNEHANLTFNNFKKDISLTETVFPQFGNKVDWTSLSGRLMFLENFPDDDGVLFAIKYKATGNEELNNDRSYLGLMKIYQQLNQIYKVNGDINSANSCYSEMKDIEGRKLEHDFEKQGGFQKYFRWKLNRLMKFYTRHGTDPARAIVMSIWIVMAFAIFYFFFPSEWDRNSKREIVQQFRDMIGRNDKGYFKPFFKMTGAFLISFINAFTLSLNSFTTLGFGNIPTVGLARYVCVLEGFVGWFLLSIFTVALINQVMF